MLKNAISSARARLLYERMRIAKQVVNGEVVANMFTGVGCFSIIIAKQRLKKSTRLMLTPRQFNLCKKTSG